VSKFFALPTATADLVVNNLSRLLAESDSANHGSQGMHCVQERPR